MVYKNFFNTIVFVSFSSFIVVYIFVPILKTLILNLHHKDYVSLYLVEELFSHVYLLLGVMLINKKELPKVIHLKSILSNILSNIAHQVY